MRAWKKICWGLSVLSIMFASGCVFRMREGSVFSDFMLPSTEEERQLGEMFLIEMKRRAQFIQDPFVLSYLDSVGQSLADQARPQPFKYRFYLFSDSRINAFAAPAAQVFVSTGLVLESEGESELAGVLSHEIAHVSHRHVARMVQSQQGMAIPTIVGIMAGLMARDPEVGQAIILGTMAGQMSLFLSYSRTDEQEADRYGLVYLNRSGYDPQGIIRFLGRLIKEYGVESGIFAPYLSTHPPLIRRISYLESLVPREFRSETPVVDDSRLRRVQAKLTAKLKDINTARSCFTGKLNENPEDANAHFGLALVYQRMEEWEKALEELGWVEARNEKDVEVLWETGITYLGKGDFDLAVRVFHRATGLDPENEFLYFALGRAYYEARRYQPAIDAYEKVISLNPEMADAYYQMGVIYGEMGQYGQAHYFLGRDARLRGDREQAGFHFHKALSYCDEDSTQAKKIEAEIEHLKRR